MSLWNGNVIILKRFVLQLKKRYIMVKQDGYVIVVIGPVMIRIIISRLIQVGGTCIIRQTSLWAYHDIQDDGTVETDQQLYVSLLRALGVPSTDREVAAYGNVDVMRVERRRNDLMHEGLIIDMGIRKCGISDRLCHVWWFSSEDL